MSEQKDPMHDFWEQGLSAIHREFSQNLAGMQKYCELCEVSFYGRTPNYSSPTQQHLYLLRYFSAYLFEYFEAFSLLKQSNFLTQPQIVSFGCGSGIDGAAARFAFSQCSYMGIDLVAWNPWFLPQPPALMNASEFIPSTQDVFVFPKSLSELPDGIVTALAENLPTTSAQKVCIINSRRTRDSSDGDKCTRLLQAFGSTNNNTQLFEVVPNKGALVYYQRWFSYPDDISRHIKTLSSRCPSSSGTGTDCCAYSTCKPCAGKSKKPMEWNPVFTDVNFCTQIYLIQR